MIETTKSENKNADQGWLTQMDDKERLGSLLGQLAQRPRDPELVTQVISLLERSLNSFELPPAMVGLLEQCPDWHSAGRMLRHLHRHGIPASSVAKTALSLKLRGQDRHLLMDSLAEVVQSDFPDVDYQLALLRLRLEREDLSSEDFIVQLYLEGRELATEDPHGWDYDVARIVRRRRPDLSALHSTIEAHQYNEQKRRKVSHVDIAAPLDPSRSVFLSNLDYGCDETKIRVLFADLPIKSVNLLRTKGGKSRGLAEVEFETEEARAYALTRDRTRLEGRIVFISPHGSSQKQKLSKSYDPSTLFCSHLPADCTREDLVALFGDLQIRMIHEHQTGRFKGIAYVQFESEGMASKALMQLTNPNIRGHPIRVQVSDQLGAKPVKEHPALAFKPRTLNK